MAATYGVPRPRRWFDMTALMPDRTRPSAGELQRDLRHRRPLVLLATLAGAAAAASTLLVCLALGVAGWFLTDAGAHGTPRDGLWVGALAWLMAHGSGVHVGGALVSVMPLGITLACGWVTWRIGHRLGDSISGHGPDAQRIADGERDWTVPVAALLYAAGYVVVAAVHRRARLDRRHGARHLAGRALVVPALRRARRARDRDRLRPRRDLDRHPPGVGRRGRGRVPPGGQAVARRRPGRLPGRARHRLRHRAQRHLAAAHRHRRHRAAGRHLAAGGPERRGLLRLLPARPRLHGRDPHDRLARRRHRRRAADVPAAGRACPTPDRRRAGRLPSSACRPWLRRSVR